MDSFPSSFLDLIKRKETVLDKLISYLEPDKNDVKLFNGVFTPIELVCNMLSKLPHRVWINPNLVWLDPTNGFGNFSLIVYYKLMFGLAKAIPDKSERSKHIIEKMVWMIELNPINTTICKKIFYILDPYSKLNIITGKFLDKTTLASLPYEFDIIMSNPPYTQLDKEVWIDYIKQSIGLLKKMGIYV